MRRAALALLLAPALAAQGLTSGGLRGVVRAADGTPLPGARIELEEHRTGRRHLVLAGADGTFRFRGLEPGPCRLTVTAEGYGGQRLAGLDLRAGTDTELPVELIPMEAGMILDTDAPEGRQGQDGATLLRLRAPLLRALPLRSRGLAELADLGPWPAPPASALQVDGLDLGAPGGSLSPLGPEALAEARILAGGGEAGVPAPDTLLAATREGGNRFEGEALALWGPAQGGAGDRRAGALAASGPLRSDRLFLSASADREDPGDGARATRGALRVDWLPSDTQQATLRALEALGDGRDRSLALAHRWAPGRGFVQEARVQARDLDLPGLGPARAWEAADALGLALGAHDLEGGADLQQLRSEALPGAAWRRAGIFLQDAWRLAPPFRLRLGLRRDREDLATGGAREGTSPRLAFTWQLSERLTLSGGHGRFLEPAPLVPVQSSAAWPDRRESRLGLDFRPIPDLSLTVEGRDATGRLAPGGGDRDRLQGASLGGRWQVGGTLDLAASWTLLHTRSTGRLEGTLHRLRLWIVWDTRDLASPWTRNWTLALVGRLQSGAETPVPGLPVAPDGAPVLDLRLARTLVRSRLRIEALLDAFDLLDRSRPAMAGGDAGRRVQIGVRAAF